jgi:hypothetical protein
MKGMKDFRFGKFEILAVYMCRKGMMEGMNENDAKRYGFAIACLGAQAKRGVKKSGVGSPSVKDVVAAASKKKKSVITSKNYDDLLRRRFGSMASFFEADMDLLLQHGLFYDEVELLADISPKFGAKITWSHWRNRVMNFVRQTSKSSLKTIFTKVFRRLLSFFRQEFFSH